MFVKGVRALTYSEIRTWKQCRVKHDMSYRQKFTAKEGASYFRRGNFVHRFIERMYLEIKPGKITFEQLMAELEKEWNLYAQSELTLQKDEDLKVEYAVIRGMVNGYYHYFFLKEEFEGYLPELEVSVTVGEAVAWAKIDGVVKTDGKYFINEIKSVSGFSETDKKMLNIDDQTNHYLMAVRSKYPTRKFVGAIRTVLRAPSIKQTQKETLEQYCNRVVADYQARPDFYLQRVIVLKTDEQIDAYADYFQRIYREIIDNDNIFKNPVSMQCGGCDFFDWCTEPNEDLKTQILARDFTVRQHAHAEYATLLGQSVQFIEQSKKEA
jgi:hypothetical protein